MNCRMKCWKIGVLVVLGIAALGWVVMALWNWLLPDLFGIREITYVQAMGVLLLSKILFGGFRGHCGGHHKWHHHHHEGMTAEEREKLKDGCGCSGSGRSTPETGS